MTSKEGDAGPWILKWLITLRKKLKKILASIKTSTVHTIFYVNFALSAFDFYTILHTCKKIISLLYLL